MLHKKFGIKTKTHDAFLENIVQYLVNESIGSATTRVIRKRADKAAGCQFEGHHYLVHIPKHPGSKIGSKKCTACNFGKKELSEAGHPVSLKCKLTSYQCNVCEVLITKEVC